MVIATQATDEIGLGHHLADSLSLVIESRRPDTDKPVCYRIELG